MPPLESALEFCNENIKYYEDARDITKNWYFTLQVSTIILGGLTPILILCKDIPDPLQALPSTLASIIAGLSHVFRLHNNYTRFGYTAEILKTEKLMFETRAAKIYDLEEKKALRNFILQIENIIRQETSEWRKLRETVETTSIEPQQAEKLTGETRKNSTNIVSRK